MSAPKPRTATVYLFLVRSRVGYLVCEAATTRDYSRRRRRMWAELRAHIGKRIRVEVPLPEARP